MTLHQQLLRSLVSEGIPPVRPVTVQPVKLNERLWSLHRKCADGTITPDEEAELERLCNEMERDQ